MRSNDRHEAGQTVAAHDLCTNLPATYGYMKLRQTGAVLNERI